MFHIKLTARPDARMVEVPLDIEVELPREFDGAALLASSGLPRKVRLRAPRDAIKLSTAYRLDQLVGEMVRQALRGTALDGSRAQEAAALFLKNARERRQDGSALVIESNGRGRIDVVELAPAGVPAGTADGERASKADTRSAVDAAALEMLSERVALLERGLATLEARFMASPHAEPSERALRTASEQLERRIDHRLADLEEQLVAAQQRGGERQLRPAHSPSTPAPVVRRATAVEAFAAGLRAELKLRASTMAQTAKERAELCSNSAQLARDAQQASGHALPALATLERLALDANARSTALGRIADEAELYEAAEIPIASQLLDRLTRGDFADPLPLVRAVAEEGWLNGSVDVAWFSRAAALSGWTVIAPAPGDPFDSTQHDVEGLAGETIETLLAPGVRDAKGAVLMPARVRARSRADEELPSLDRSLLVPLAVSSPPPPSVGGAVADDDWERVAQGPAAFGDELHSSPDLPAAVQLPLVESGEAEAAASATPPPAKPSAPASENGGDAPAAAKASHKGRSRKKKSNADNS